MSAVFCCLVAYCCCSGLGARKLADEMDMTQAQAKAFLDRYCCCAAVNLAMTHMRHWQATGMGLWNTCTCHTGFNCDLLIVQCEM
jgi:hypothetical protein